MVGFWEERSEAQAEELVMFEAKEDMAAEQVVTFAEQE